MVRVSLRGLACSRTGVGGDARDVAVGDPHPSLRDAMFRARDRAYEAAREAAVVGDEDIGI
jgi:hypothetical protein